MNRALLMAPVLGLGLIMAGCSGSGSGNGLLGNKNPRLRAVADFPDQTSVNAVSDNGSSPDVTLLLNSPFGNVGDYQIVANGQRTVTFKNPSTNLNIGSDVQQMNLNTFYTVIGTGSGPSGRKLIFLNDAQSIANNQTRVRFVNANQDDASVDFYVTTTTTSTLTGQTAVVSGDAFGDGTQPYTAFNPGTFTIWVTPAGTPGTVLLKKNVTFDTNTIITLVFAKSSGGAVLQTLLDNPVTHP